jgi:hypothetical protein
MDESGQRQAPAVLTSEESSQYLLNRKIGGSQNRSGQYGGDNNLLSLPGIEQRPSSPSYTAQQLSNYEKTEGLE